MAKKARCTFKQCREVAQRIVGDCGFCHGHFCGKHRLLEDHKCSGLEDVSISRSSSVVSSPSSSSFVGATSASISERQQTPPPPPSTLRESSPRGYKVSKKRRSPRCNRHNGRPAPGHAATAAARSVVEPTAPATKWWLVGLYDTLDMLNSDSELFTDLSNSAKSSPMSKTLPSSSQSAPLSSRVFNETDYDDY